MATTMRKETREKQYQLYLDTYNKQAAAGNLKPFAKKFTFETFNKFLDSHLAELPSGTSGNQKYELGKTIFFEEEAQYTSKRQIAHLRKEVAAGFEKRDLNIESAAYDQLGEFLKGHTYRNKGKLVIRQDFFSANIGTIMDLFRSANGYIGES